MALYMPTLTGDMDITHMLCVLVTFIIILERIGPKCYNTGKKKIFLFFYFIEQPITLNRL